MTTAYPSDLELIPTISSHPELWISLTIMGMRSPGVVKLRGDGLKVKIDNAEPGGSDGATTTIKGKAVRQFEASFYLWDDAESGLNHLAAWEVFRAMLVAQSDAPKPIGYPCTHPELDAAGYKAVCVESIALPEYDDQGGATVKVKFSEFTPPKPRLSGSINGIAPDYGPPFDPNWDRKQELERLLAESARLDNPTPNADGRGP